jgi:bifunctional enzyme CysN/CysC
MASSLLRVLTCGSVDDGKSTLIGRLLFECGKIPDDVMVALERDSRRHGTVDGGVDYALLVDGLAAEREQGITIDVAYRYFETERRRFILVDSPGHEQYTRNMVTGASNADLAVLLVDARKGLLIQTRRHAKIVSMLGIRHVVLAVNKMDLVNYDQAVFSDIAEAFAEVAEGLGLDVQPIPMSALGGDNVTRPSPAMSWYHGPTLLAFLTSVDATQHAEARPFRMHVQWVNRPDASFRGFSGTVDSGTVRPGMRVSNVLARTFATVERIVTMDGDLPEARHGDAITLVLDREIDCSRGDVIAASGMPDASDRLTARVMWMDDTPLFRGRQYLFMLGCRTISGTVTEIAHRLDIDTYAELSAHELHMNEIGRVSIELSQPVVFEPYEASREMGGFIMIDRMTNATVGAGIIDGAEHLARDVHWHKMEVDKRARAALKNQTPAVLWFTGLSGAGKSTIANLVEKRLHAMGHHTIILDGDNVRHGLNRDLGFDEADRVENIRRVAEVAKLFVEAGLIVLVSFISPYRAERMLARERVEEGEFIEIFVDTPIEECRRRDPKGLYAKADAGQIRNFTGIDAPYEAPTDPEIWLPTLGTPPEELTERLVDDLRRRRIVV